MQAGSTIANAIQVSDYGSYAVKIFNNTPDLSIFPVFATATSETDEWLQAAFRVPRSKIAQLTFAHRFQYRMYIRPRVGIGPGEHVVLTLPLCSQLLGAPNGTRPDEYIDWWNAGRIYLYNHPVAAGAPPALTGNFEIDTPNIVAPLTPGPSCAGCPMPFPPIYRRLASELPDDPAQLTEYTLGAIDKGDVYQIVPDMKIVDCSTAAMEDIDMPDIRVVIG
jgi:hypothetical protein